MNESSQINKAIEFLSLWVHKINLSSAVDFYDINKVSENLAEKLLNEIYGYQLNNLNAEKRNFPAVDLGCDIEKIAFQITSTQELDKIKSTLTKFVDHDLHQRFTNGVYFLFLTTDKAIKLTDSNRLKYQKIYTGFNDDKHLLTVQNLIQDIQVLYSEDNQKFCNVLKILECELSTSSEQFDAKAEELGVTKAALRTFFRILQQGEVKPDDYDHTLRQIAERYLNCLRELTAFQSEDPEVKALLNQAEQVLEQGDFDRAEGLINEAKAKDLAAAKQLQANANLRFLSAAKAAAQNGQLQLTQIHYEKAVQYFQEAAEIVPSGFFEELASYLNEAGKTWCDMGKYDKAEPLLQRSLNILETQLGNEHFKVACVLNNLAELYAIQANYEKAELLHQRSLTIREKLLGNEHLEIAISLNNLAEIYRIQGKYTQAELFHQRSLDILKENLGEEHLHVANSINNLALVYYFQGKHSEAEPLLKQSLAIREKILGDRHPDVADSLNNLAEFYRILGKYEQAEILCKRSLIINEKILGMEHPTVATNLNNLALIYKIQEKYDDAESLYKRGLAINEKMLGSHHPVVAGDLNNLASLYQSQGKYDEAETLYQRSLSIREKALGNEHPSVVISLSNLATLYYAQGKAEPLLQRGLAIAEQALGNDHPNTQQVKAHLQKLQTTLHH